MKTKNQEFDQMLEENKDIQKKEKKSLFGIQQDYQNIMDSILDADGEVTEEMQKSLAINEKDLQQKTIGYIKVINKETSKVDFIDKELNRLKNLKNSKSNAIELLKTSISNAMELYGLDEIETPLNKVNFRKSERTIVDLDILPKKYFTTVKVPPSKSLLKALVKDGTSIKGVSFIQNRKLQIR